MSITQKCPPIRYTDGLIHIDLYRTMINTNPVNGNDMGYWILGSGYPDTIGYYFTRSNSNLGDRYCQQLRPQWQKGHRIWAPNYFQLLRSYPEAYEVPQTWHSKVPQKYKLELAGFNNY